jgi:hypothetical protein
MICVQALLVSLTAIFYEFLLLKSSDVEAMKRFSVFLALPTGIVRTMASKVMLVSGDCSVLRLHCPASTSIAEHCSDNNKLPATFTDHNCAQQATLATTNIYI